MVRLTPNTTHAECPAPLENAYCCCCCCCCVVLFAVGGGATVQSGQPITTSLRVRWSFSRRLVISVRNCSSDNATRLPRSMNILATERLPEPCQLRGSGMFLFDGELSI